MSHNLNPNFTAPPDDASQEDLERCYEQAEHNITVAQSHLDSAIKARSAVVQAFAKKVSPAKVATLGGKTMTIVNRGSLYFFRSPKSNRTASPKAGKESSKQY